MKLSDIAKATGLDYSGDGSIDIRGVASIDDATEGTLAFLADPAKKEELMLSGASAFILPEGVSCEGKPYMVSNRPLLAFADVVGLFYPRPQPKGVDARAIIEEGVSLGDGLSLYPNVYIGRGASIGDGVSLYPGVYIGPGCTVGEGSTLYANVVVNEGTAIGKRVIIHGGTVIGSDGYGFAWDGTCHRKIPQVGGVVIGDDVEIGANCTVDRATLGNTIIKRGSKIDNLVMVAHNCVVGEDVLIVSQSGLAGSAKLGDNVIIAGQVGVAGHLTIGDGAIIGPKSGVTKDVEAGAKVTGYPPQPHREWMRIQNTIQKLPEMRKELRALHDKIERLEKENHEA